jgi:hypothetical protein
MVQKNDQVLYTSCSKNITYLRNLPSPFQIDLDFKVHLRVKQTKII